MLVHKINAVSFIWLWRLSLLQEAQSRIFVYYIPCTTGGLGSSLKVIGMNSYSEDPTLHPPTPSETPSERWLERNKVGGVHSKDLPNTVEQLEK